MEEKRKEIERQNFRPVNSSDNGAATVLYIFVMIFGAIFVDALLIWFTASIIYVLYRTKNKKK